MFTYLRERNLLGSSFVNIFNYSPAALSCSVYNLLFVFLFLHYRFPLKLLSFLFQILLLGRGFYFTKLILFDFYLEISISGCATEFFTGLKCYSKSVPLKNMLSTIFSGLGWEEM